MIQLDRISYKRRRCFVPQPGLPRVRVQREHRVAWARIAYNLLCGGRRLEHIELRRNDEVFADALGAQRIPDPTTAGDFCRRFEVGVIEVLMETINEVRVGVWHRQPEEFFNLAVIDSDGTMSETTGQCAVLRP